MMTCKYCKGCGLQLQKSDDTKDGFIFDIENQSFCVKCFRLKEYGEVKNTKVKYEDIIKKIKDVALDNINDTRFFFVIDSIDIIGTRDLLLEEILKNNEVFFCVNKIDIFSKSKNIEEIYRFAVNQLNGCKIKNYKILLVSSKQLSSIDNLNAILTNSNSKNYFIGLSNSGKTSLINACLHQLNIKNEAITSPYINTTSDFMEVKFTENCTIVDTPGIGISHSIINAFDYIYWKKFIFNEELKQYTYQISSSNSIIVEKICYIDVLNAPDSKKFSIHFWVNKNFYLHRTKTLNIKKYLEVENSLIKPIIDKYRKQKFKFTDFSDKMLIISGLGWVTFRSFPGLEIDVSIPNIENKISIYLANDNV